MKLERGCIYSAKYKRYRVDRSPTLLVLWTDGVKLHAINLNYLDAAKAGEAASFVSRHLETVVTNYDAYAFYHRYVKRQAGSVVRAAYRTYFVRELRNAKAVSANALQSINVLRGLESSRRAAEAKGAEPATPTSPKNAVSGSAAKPGEVVADYVDMLSRMFPKRETRGAFSRLFGRRG